MSSMHRAALCAASLSVAVCAIAQQTTTGQRAPFTYQDLIQLDRVGGLQVDPAGKQALYTVRATDLEKNKGVTALWSQDLSAPERPASRLAISDGGAVDVQWSPDGASIYFLSARGEGHTMQVWRSDATGAKAEQVTSLPLDVSAYRVVPGGKGLVVSLAVFPQAEGDEIAYTAKRQAERSMGSGTVYDRLFVRHWDTWSDGTRNHLFFVPPSGGPVALTQGFDGDVPSKPFGDEADFCLSPDGNTVYFSARLAGTTEPWSTNFDLYTVPTTGGMPKDLTAANPAWDAAPVVSPDGRTLAYKAMARPGFEADRFVVKLMNIDGTARTLDLSQWDRSVDDLRWSADGKSLLVTADDLGSHRLFRIALDKGTVTPLSGAGHIDAFAETPSGFVLIKSAMNSPGVLYRQKGKPGKGGLVDATLEPLSKANKLLQERTFGAYEQFSFSGWNNETVHGYVVRPVGYQEGQKYPVAFLIHGGPQSSFGDMWSYRWNAQSYAGAGYAVVMIDFHGSTGYGQAFTDAISTHWGDRPLEDLQKGWAYALKTYPFLDADRAAALGASYGGFMVNWIAGNWSDPWKCLVSHDGVFDARSMGYTTEEQWFSEWENGANVYTDPGAYDRFNPALHATKWHVPMLIVHSDLDHRIPVEQGIGAFTALQARGVPSQFLRFPDENHWVLKPRNSMQWHATVFGWLGTYLEPGGRPIGGAGAAPAPTR